LFSILMENVMTATGDRQAIYGESYLTM
jgi:hypothetical protein